jgi:beta-N-acetylhexosaminidase
VHPGRATAVALVVVAAAVTGAAHSVASLEQVATPTIPQLIGQRLVVSFAGTTPSAALLDRARRGRIGGVILFGANVRDRTQMRDLTRRLHAAALNGGQPRLLVMVDQEGGDVRRFHSLPPALSAKQLGAGPPSGVRRAGHATGGALRALGIDVDLAPVADVPRVEGAFIDLQERAFSRVPDLAAASAVAFARGLGDGGVLATAKHFPGLGGAVKNTDLAAVRITGSTEALEADLAAFRRLIDDGVALVMLSSAVYPSYGGAPALWAARVHELLRRDLGFRGVTISDALEPLARTRRRSLDSVALLAARAGTDLLLFAGTEAQSDATYASLLAAAREGRLPRQGLERSYARVLRLKSSPVLATAPA